MNRHPFSLSCFGGTDAAKTGEIPGNTQIKDIHADAIQVNGNICVHQGSISLEFFLSGVALDDVVWPPLAAVPGRRDKLWQHTCFEMFVSQPGRIDYHEFNFSPSGDWALYAFKDYRKAVDQSDDGLPMQFGADIPFQSNFLREQGRASFLVDCGLTAEFEKTPLEFGLSAVLETTTGHKHYYALRHSGDKPDFHQRQDFSLSIMDIE